MTSQPPDDAIAPGCEGYVEPDDDGNAQEDVDNGYYDEPLAAE